MGGTFLWLEWARAAVDTVFLVAGVVVVAVLVLGSRKGEAVR
jgi:hypothetical protein